VRVADRSRRCEMAEAQTAGQALGQEIHVLLAENEHDIDAACDAYHKCGKIFDQAAGLSFSLKPLPGTKRDTQKAGIVTGTAMLFVLRNGKSGRNAKDSLVSANIGRSR
jgi:hypothetical protein